MKRSLICAICICFAFSSNAVAQDGIKKLWPFAAKTKSSGDGPAMNDFFTQKPATSKKTLGLPKPTKMLDGVEKSTGAVFGKTKKTFSGFQDFGKSLNPFARKAKKPSKKESMWRRLMPKQQAKTTVNNPSTMSDFMSMERPSF